ncbi:MAG TPA: ThiF family adenylyltransferase [Vicinamibacterales bacterium]|nr:ThiF family adenylyltransferase [Vicinamibacterales bacterium]
MIWYFDNPARSKREREAIETLASQVTWMTPLGLRVDESLRLIWDIDLSTHERTYPVSLRYPNHFPHSPPVVLPRGDSEHWSSHQYGPGGELCLEYGPDNWHPEITGADMILSAYRLLSSESITGEAALVPSRHKTTLGQDLRNRFTRFVITRGAAEALARVDDDVVVSAKAVGALHEESWVNAISSIAMPSGETWVEHEMPEPFRAEGWEREIAIFRWPEGVRRLSVKTSAEFRAGARERGLSIPNVSHVLLLQGSQIHAYGLGDEDAQVWQPAVIVLPPTSPRLDPDHAALAEGKVAVIGCGSIGSKIAVMLARSGAKKFLLVDDDMMLPDNLVRHDLDWREIGTHKADSVARRIQLVNPGASCERRRHRLGGQEASGSVETLIESLAGCDLIVDATANPVAFNYLCAAVALGKRALVWAEVFGGGFGGLVARHRPDHEPDPASMRRMIEAWCADRGKPIARAANDYGGAEEAPLIADDADVTVLAAHAARLAIDTLLARTPSMFPNSVYLIGLSKGWIFEAPFDTYPIDVGQPQRTDAGTDSPEAAAEIATVIQLLTDYQNAASPAGSNPPANSSGTQASGGAGDRRTHDG